MRLRFLFLCAFSIRRFEHVAETELTQASCTQLGILCCRSGTGAGWSGCYRGSIYLGTLTNVRTRYSAHGLTNCSKKNCSRDWKNILRTRHVHARGMVRRFWIAELHPQPEGDYAQSVQKTKTMHLATHIAPESQKRWSQHARTESKNHSWIGTLQTIAFPPHLPRQGSRH